MELLEVSWGQLEARLGDPHRGTAIFAGETMPGGWWLVVGYMVLTWSLHGPMRSPHSDDSNHSNPIWPGGLVGISTETHQRQAKHQPVWTGISQERPDEELCSLKVEGVSHRVAAPGIGVWMLGSVKDLWILPMHPTTPWRVRYGKHHLPRNPAFDVTPASLISGIVTDCGLIPKRSQDERNLDEGKRVKNERALYHYMTINNFDQSVLEIHVWFPLRSGWIKGLQRLFLTCRNWFSVQDIQFICSIGPWFGMRSLAMSCFSMAVTFILVRILTWLPLCRRRSEKWTANDAEICSKISLLRKGARQEHNEDGFLNAFSVCFYCTYGDDTVALILCPVSWTQGIPRLRNFRWQMF